MPKWKRPEPDVLLRMPISEFFSLCTVEKGIIQLSFNKMTALLAHAKGKQSTPAMPQHKAELDKLRAEVLQLKARAKANTDAAGEEVGTCKKPKQTRKKPDKLEQKEKEEGEG